MNTKGFTLVELIVAVATGMVIMLAIYAASEMGQRSSVGVGRKVVTQQDVRAALDLMAIEISMASFNPLRKVQANNMWRANNCVGASTTQGYKGLQIATSNEILIEMDINQDGVIGANEIIDYQYDSANHQITRQVNCKPLIPLSDFILLGGTNAETNVINDAEGISLFRYYNKAGDETTDPSKIRRVEITIAAETAFIDPNTKNKKRMIYSTTTIVRNHVLSP